MTGSQSVWVGRELWGLTGDSINFGSKPMAEITDFRSQSFSETSLGGQFAPRIIMLLF
jgi:hypothetical protein